MSEQVSIYLAKKSLDKRASREDNNNSGGGTKKWVVTKKMVEKWISDNNKTLNTIRWLNFKMASSDREHMTMLKCAVCGKYKDKLCSMRNYRPAFVEGTTNINFVLQYSRTTQKRICISERCHWRLRQGL